MSNIDDTSGESGKNGTTRREWISRIGGGFGGVALNSILAEALNSPASASTVPASPVGVRSRFTLDPRQPHFKARAKRVIYLFMNGGPSHVDTFDPKSALVKYAGN